MSDILFISTTPLNPELELLRNEISSRGFSFSEIYNLEKVVSVLKITQAKTLIINAENNKIEVFEFCNRIKDTYTHSLQIFVYLPDATINEASKFGLLGAEVEDQNSIANVVDKLLHNNQEELNKKNIIGFLQINGSNGLSSMLSLFAIFLSEKNKNITIAESSNRKSLAQFFAIPEIPDLLASENKNEIIEKDSDWFTSFITSTNQAKIHYLNLFNNINEKLQYENKKILALDYLFQKIKNLDLKDFDLSQKLWIYSNSLKLIKQDLEGSSSSILQEALEFIFRNSELLLCDLGNDCYSSINKEILRRSKYLILVFDKSIDELTYNSYLKALEPYQITIIPIIKEYKHQTNQNQEILEYPYDPETIVRTLINQESLNHKSKLYEFYIELSQRIGIRFPEQIFSKSMRLLKFLHV